MTKFFGNTFEMTASANYAEASCSCAHIVAMVAIIMAAIFVSALIRISLVIILPLVLILGAKKLTPPMTRESA